MRKYQPIWNELKQYYTASCVAPTTSHRRIIQAVRKERTKDDGWQLQIVEKGARYWMRHSIVGSRITFYLIDKSPPRLEEL